jgi:hypothetical protein
LSGRIRVRIVHSIGFLLGVGGISVISYQLSVRKGKWGIRVVGRWGIDARGWGLGVRGSGELGVGEVGNWGSGEIGRWGNK